MEDQQDSILNEFLERIKTIERKNDILREKILNKNEELIKLENEKINPKKEQEKKDEIITEKIPNDEKEELEAKKAIENYKSIKSNKLYIENNAIEYLIEFNTQEQYNVLYIMGDFTKWELTPMEKSKDKFTYSVILLKGYKYYYSFQAGDEILIDYNNLYEENPRTFQIQNFIDLSQNNKEILFDFKNDMNSLKLMEKNYFLSKIDIKEEEYMLLIKLKNRGELIKKLSKEKNDKYYKLSSSINSYFDELNYNIESLGLKNKLNKFRNYFKNKIIVQNNIKDSKNQNLIYYIILELSDNYLFRCEKLYDNNNIKISRDYYTHNIFYYYISPNQISLLPIKPESKSYHLLSLEESQKILEKYNKDETTIIKAYFKTLSNLKNPNLVGNEILFDDYYLSRNIFLVKPKKIEPEGINMNDYDFYYSYNKITKVRNNKERIDVQFKIIDESVEKNKRPNRFEIYYGIKEKKLYLIHCHVLDKELRNAKMIIKEIDKNTDTHIIKKNEEYIKNNELLLIIQDLIPIKLYHKGKKVKSNIVKIDENKIYLLQSPNIESICNKMYVKVIHMRIDNLYNMEVILKELGRRIREYRIGLSITQDDFAKKIGVSTRTISSIENGADTSFSTIIRVLDGLKLITNLNLLIPEKENYIIQEPVEKKRYRKSNKNKEWKWGDEK